MNLSYHPEPQRNPSDTELKHPFWIHCDAVRTISVDTIWTVLLGLIVTLGCSSSTKTSPDAGLGELEPTLATLQEHVFAPACALSGCHDDATRAGNLNLSSQAASYAALVDVPVTNAIALENGWLLVKPGDPELSFVVRKMRLPGLGEGAPMPIGEFQVSDYYMTLLEEWISLGAEQ